MKKKQKKYKVGSEFYRDLGLKTIVVHVEGKTYRALVDMAHRDRRSLLQTVKWILEEKTGTHR